MTSRSANTATTGHANQTATPESYVSPSKNKLGKHNHISDLLLREGGLEIDINFTLCTYNIIWWRLIGSHRIIKLEGIITKLSKLMIWVHTSFKNSFNSITCSSSYTHTQNVRNCWWSCGKWHHLSSPAISGSFSHLRDSKFFVWAELEFEIRKLLVFRFLVTVKSLKKSPNVLISNNRHRKFANSITLSLAY